MELIIGLIGALATLIGTVWGIVKYYDVKRTKAEAEAKTKQDARDTVLDTILKTLGNLQMQVTENEMDRLRTDIINCANKLQNGYTVTSDYLEHIHHAYDKYIAGGGNSYIEDCMAYVRAYEEECRRNGIIGFSNTDD
jgi:uncharacterized protein YpuA (DUF1002 family)